MRLKRPLFFTATMAVLLLAARVAMAAPADEKDKVLRQLDLAAANFRSASADFEFDSVTTDPIPDKDVQKGEVYYQRKGKTFQMAAHIETENGKPDLKIYGIFAGVVKLYEKLTNQVTTFSRLGQFESWFMLGFGASGKDLEDKWEITCLGPETLDGIKTEKLELVAKDLAVRKNLPKVTVWMDTERGISLKQVFDEGPGQYRVSVYFNIKVNQPLPKNAFILETDKQTQYVNR
jgi:outer membrane lipoprotein-sorting protein